MCMSYITYHICRQRWYNPVCMYIGDNLCVLVTFTKLPYTHSFFYGHLLKQTYLCLLELFAVLNVLLSVFACSACGALLCLLALSALLTMQMSSSQYICMHPYAPICIHRNPLCIRMAVRTCAGRTCAKV